MTQLDLRFFGSVQVAVDGETAVDFDYSKMKALLAYLVVEANSLHRREAVAELLWPGKPDKVARNSLRQALAKLRRAIHDQEAKPPFLLIARDTIRFNPNSHYQLDVAAFTAVFQAIRQHSHPQLTRCKPCIKQLEQAAALYRGEFLAGFSLKDSAEFEEWLAVKREAYRRQAVEMYRDLAAYSEDRGAYEVALPFARHYATLSPWQDAPQQQVMRLLALNGQSSKALAQYDSYRQELRRELDIEPETETAVLYERIRAGLLTPPKRPSLPNLPLPRTPFVGRQTELDQIVQRLTHEPGCRLLTLTGIGGIGKTRLALEAVRHIAANHCAEFRHGIIFVPMLEAHTPEQMVVNLAAALHVSFGGKKVSVAPLLDFLREKEILLVIDNFEHLLDESDFLEAILTQAPHVKLLLTSRERLNFYEEWVFPLTGLRYPTAADDAEPMEFEAVQLFMQVAQRTTRFEADGMDATAVSRICHLLEGVPLGIELAAAWTDRLACPEIAAEIERGLDVLQASWRNFPSHHRSLRVVFDRSWQMLSAVEQIVLCRLSLFQDAFAAEAAAHIASADPSTLTTLVDKSFLRLEANDHFDHAQRRRYQMHPLLQHYAIEKWDEYAAPEKEGAMALFSDYYAAFMQQREPDLLTSHLQAALAAIDAVANNVRQGWRWAAQQQRAEALAPYLTGYFHYLGLRGQFQDGLALFTLAAERVEDAALLGMILTRQGMFHFRLSQYAEAETAVQKSLALTLAGADYQRVQAAGLQVLGHVRYGQGEYAAAEQQYLQSIALFQQANDRYGQAKSLNSLGVIKRLRGQYDQAQTHLQQALAITRELDDLYDAAVSLNNLGSVLRLLGQYDEAQQCFEESFRYRQTINDQNGLALTLNNLGNIASILKKPAAARAAYEESLTICQQLGDRLGVARALNNLGIEAYLDGQYEAAERYHRESLDIKQAIGDDGGMVHSYYQLGRTALAVGEADQAWDYFERGLQTAVSIQSVPLMLMCLVGIVPLLAARSSASFAFTVTAVALRHPALFHQMHQAAQATYDELVETLAEEAVSAVQSQVEQQTLDDMAARVLALGEQSHRHS